MEQDFSERLKKYRREKALTQQELADILQISNKTISRWESGGGYPDVSMLVPLARALNVTVDDLLDGDKPIRTLTTEDWQSMLSFAFALGGGVCFYLLNLFMPVVVCYLAYLGCMSYGVYLQKHYSYQSRWFYIGNAIMNLTINFTIVSNVTLALFSLAGIGNLTELVLQVFEEKDLAPWSIIVTVVLVSAALTAVTLYLTEFLSTGRRPAIGLRLRLGGKGWMRFIPTLGMILLTIFWAIFGLDGVAPELYAKQRIIYYSLLGLLTLSALLFSFKRGQRQNLLSVALMVLGGLGLPGMAMEYAWLPVSQRVIEVTSILSERYIRFGVLSPKILTAGIVVSFLCLMLALIRVEQKELSE